MILAILILLADNKSDLSPQKDSLNGVFLNYSRIGSELREVFVGDDISFGVDIDPSVEQQLPWTFGIFTVKAEPAPAQNMDRTKKNNNGDKAPPTNNPLITIKTPTKPTTNPNPTNTATTVAAS